MSLLSLNRVRIAFGGAPLLDDVTLQIERDERIGLVGRNGEGKSTLLKLLNGDLRPDAGDVIRSRDVGVARLTQEAPRDMEGSVSEIVARDWNHEHGLDHPVERMITLMELPAAEPYATLSGGLRRRTLLARALINEPDVLLLDEPTNHLDVDSIQWLERFLLRRRGALLFITHDRVFLQKLATRILELDRGRLTSWACDYQTYLQRRQALLDAEVLQQTEFDKKLAREEVWIRQGIRARRTRNEGRVRELLKLREERRQRRERVGTVRIQAHDAERSGHKVIETVHLSCGHGDRIVARDLSLRILRGDRVGILGPNGCGKTTLLNTLLGRCPPLHGEVRLGTKLEIARFDQDRETLDDTRTVQQNVSGESDSVVINGQRRHVLGYLQDFLFSPDRARSPVRILSGGERNRLMLARLFARPSNLLVLDEPTNDLDLETLDLLEERLAEYSGTLLLVSHDRAFLNNVVTSTLVFEGEGRVGEYVGGYDDWVRQTAGVASAPQTNAAPLPAAGTGPRGRKRSNREREEWAALPERIESLETELETLTDALSDGTLFRQDPAAAQTTQQRLGKIPIELDAAYARWQELDSLEN